MLTARNGGLRMLCRMSGKPATFTFIGEACAHILVPCPRISHQNSNHDWDGHCLLRDNSAAWWLPRLGSSEFEGANHHGRNLI